MKGVYIATVFLGLAVGSSLAQNQDDISKCLEESTACIAEFDLSQCPEPTNIPTVITDSDDVEEALDTLKPYLKCVCPMIGDIFNCYIKSDSCDFFTKQWETSVCVDDAFNLGEFEGHFDDELKECEKAFKTICPNLSASGDDSGDGNQDNGNGGQNGGDASEDEAIDGQDPDDGAAPSLASGVLSFSILTALVAAVVA